MANFYTHSAPTVSQPFLVLPHLAHPMAVRPLSRRTIQLVLTSEAQGHYEQPA